MVPIATNVPRDGTLSAIGRVDDPQMKEHVPMAEHKPTGKRERIDTTPGKPDGSRFVRRDEHGHFTTDQTDVGRSLAADRRQQAKNQAHKGQKDRGD
jgi:hypothetical protein